MVQPRVPLLPLVGVTVATRLGAGGVEAEAQLEGPVVLGDPTRPGGAETSEWGSLKCRGQAEGPPGGGGSAGQRPPVGVEGTPREQPAAQGKAGGRQAGSLGGLGLSASPLLLVVSHKPKQEPIWVQRAGSIASRRAPGSIICMLSPVPESRRQPQRLSCRAVRALSRLGSRNPTAALRWGTVTAPL